MRVVWSPTALKRVDEISAHIALDSVPEAKRWIEKLFEHTERIEVFPESGRIVPDFDDEKLRELIFGNYRIIYEIRDEKIDVLTVRNFKRNLDEDEICRG